MIFAVSDLHGLPLGKLKQLLRQASFGSREDDFLFVLGDVIDRGEPLGGVDVLKWLMDQPNVQLLLGNHEAMLLSCTFLFDEITENSVAQFDQDKMDRLSTWLSNGAQPTIQGLKRLMSTDPDLLNDLLDYLRDCPLYEIVTAGERDFVLVHAGLGGFSPERRLSAYTPEKLLWHRPAMDERYWEDVTVIFGHTPSVCFQSDANAPVYTDTWVDIDTSAGDSPTLLCLDTMTTYRLTE